MARSLGWCGLALLVVLPVRAVEQVTVRDGVFFEAETFDARQAVDADYAGAAGDLAASSGTVLVRLYRQGTLTWRFSVPQAASYRVWMRYSAPGDAAPGLGVDQDAPAPLPCPGTGDVATFAWVGLPPLALAAGEHRLVLGSGPLRADCFWITPGPARPTDALLREVVWPAGPRLPELRHDRAITQHPSWIHRLHRVCYAHAEWNQEITTEDWCRLAAARGANLLVAVGEIPAGMQNGRMKALPVNAKELPAGYRVDYSWVRENTAAAHRHGLKYLVYVNADRTLDPLLLEHPDWRQVDSAGQPVDTWGCWSSPYRQAFIDRLVAIARDSGVDGIMIDMPFTAPGNGCHSAWCREAFHRRFEVDPPRRAVLTDPLFQRWLDFQSWTREEWLLELTEACHAVNPEFAVVANQTRGWIFDHRRTFLTARAARCVDGLLEEIGWETQHAWDRPWAWPAQGPWQNLFLHCRTWPGVGMMWHVTYHMPEVELRAQALAMLANGVLPATTVGGNWDQMSRIWQHLKPCEPYLGGELVPWAALHFGEDTLAWFANAAGREATDAWVQNVFGFFQAALETHLPVHVITDDDLADPAVLRRFAVVALPSSACLSAAQTTALQVYVEAGGGLVASFETGACDEFGARRAQPWLADLFETTAASAVTGLSWTARPAPPPQPLLDHPDLASAGQWGQGLVEPRPALSLFVGPTTRQIGVVPVGPTPPAVTRPLPLTGANARRQGVLTPPPQHSFQGLLARDLGQGRVVWAPLDLGRAYFAYAHPAGRAVISGALRWAASRPLPLTTSAPSLVQTTLFRQGDAAVVHLLNDVSSFGRSAAPNPETFSGFRSEVLPVSDIAVTVSGQFGRARALPAGTPLTPVTAGGRTTVTVPRLDQHVMLVLEP